MVVDPDDLKITLTTTPPVNGVRPAADVLFQSVARAYAGKGVGRYTHRNGQRWYRRGQGFEGSLPMLLYHPKPKPVSFTGCPEASMRRGCLMRVVDLKDIGNRIIEINRVKLMKDNAPGNLT